MKRASDSIAVIRRPMPEQSRQPATLWTKWAVMLVFLFIAYESALIAVVLKGPWLILLAPGAVCAVKVMDIWRELRKHVS